ncbi:hypothetical protein Gpo141_00002635 [Globisporangium polare]
MSALPLVSALVAAVVLAEPTAPLDSGNHLRKLEEAPAATAEEAMKPAGDWNEDRGGGGYYYGVRYRGGGGNYHGGGGGCYGGGDRGGGYYYGGGGRDWH